MAAPQDSWRLPERSLTEMEFDHEYTFFRIFQKYISPKKAVPQKSLTRSFPDVYPAPKISLEYISNIF
jgi:hypothetical protein